MAVFKRSPNAPDWNDLIGFSVMCICVTALAGGILYTIITLIKSL